jgi:hypothetical protein
MVRSRHQSTMCSHGSPSIVLSGSSLPAASRRCCGLLLLLSSLAPARSSGVLGVAVLSLPLLSSVAGCFCSWLSCVELEGGETLLLLVAMCLIIFFCALSLRSRAGLSLPRGLWVTGWRFPSNSNRIKLYSIQVSGPTSKL